MDEKVENSLKFIKSQTEQYKNNIVVLSSFGKDSIVNTHLVIQVKPDIPVLWVTPPFLPKETYMLAEEIANCWDLNLYTIESELVEDLSFMDNKVIKPDLPKTNPKECCQLFKDDPMFKYIQKHKYIAWFSGLRKTESERRSKIPRIWKQGIFTKLHPILDWTEADVWRYIAVNDLPINPLYGQGYRSLGCACCSFPNTWDSERGGRWKNTLMQGGECGLHCLSPYLKKLAKVRGLL